MKADLGLDFPLLMDPDLEVMGRYGVVNLDRPSVPHPTVVIVDSAGVVRFFHLDENYRQRPPASTLLDALRGLAAEPTAP